MKLDQSQSYGQLGSYSLVLFSLQTFLLFPLAVFSGANVFTVFLLALTSDVLYQFPNNFLTIFGIYMGVFFGAPIVTILAKWILLGRVVEGDYPIWGWYYCRFWFVRKLQRITVSMHTWELQGTPFMAWYLRALGCKIGPNCYLHTVVEGFDLITIGEGCCVNACVDISGASMEKGWLKLREVNIGDRVTLSTK